ncbi:HlyD family efflux transporter periplasmic adaptor subunit [Methylobacterium sp. P31]
MAALVSGVVSWAQAEFADRSGIVGGADHLFVVRAPRDATVKMVASDLNVQKGEIIAEFAPPGIEKQLAIFDSRIAEGQSKLDGLKHRALPIEGALLQRQAQLRAQTDQNTSFLFDLQRALREVEREQMTARTTWAREKSQLVADIAASEKSIASYDQQIAIAQTSVARANELRERNIISAQLMEDRSTSALKLTLERDRAALNLSETRRRLADLEERYTGTFSKLGAQQTRIAADIATVENTLLALAPRLREAEALLAQDTKRAEESLASERKAAEHHLNGLIAERDRTKAATEVTAPFSGRVVFRPNSPGLVSESSPILAIADSNGFQARVMMPASEIEDVARVGEVKFALDHPVLSRYFSGTFSKAEPAAHEPGRVIASFDVALPIETAMLLSSSPDAVRVRLKWAPPAWQNNGVRGSAILALIGLLFGFIRRRPRAKELLANVEPVTLPQPVTQPLRVVRTGGAA